MRRDRRGRAWTTARGVSAATTARKNTRLTFFLNGRYGAWDAIADTIPPLVDSGQIQLGNHTWSHPDFTRLSNDDIITELQRNHDYILETWGADARPFFRSPFGYHDERVDAADASSWSRPAGARLSTCRAARSTRVRARQGPQLLSTER